MKKTTQYIQFTFALFALSLFITVIPFDLAGAQMPQPPPRPAEFNNAQNDASDSVPQVQAPQAPAGGGQQVDCEATYKECLTDAEDARKACTTQDMQAGMSPAQQMQAQQMQQQAQQSNQNVGQQGNSQAGQCQNQADLSKMLSGLSALKGGACMTTVKSCESSCESTVKACKEKAMQDPAKKATYEAKAQAAAKKGQQCSGMSQNGTAALAQAAALMASMMMNQGCANATASSTSPTPLANDCSNPQFAAVTPACICAAVGSNPAADPTNAICNNGQSLTGINPSLTTTGGPSTPSSLIQDSSDGVGVDTTAIKAKTQSGTNAMEGGASGGGFGGGGGAGAGRGGGMDDGGHSPSTIDKNVITGQSGGGGGGLAGGGGGGGSGGGYGGGGGGNAGADKIDLSQWLPKGKYKALNIGGMSIKPYDGITGPMGPSIWEKVSNQYQQQKPRLIPER